MCGYRKQRVHIARKDHVCGECGFSIYKGTEYTYISGIDDDNRFYYYKVCSSCRIPESDEDAALDRSLMAMDYINNAYRLNVRIGSKVKFQGQPGTITGGKNQYLLVKLEGEKKPKIYHPTSEMEHLPC